MIYQPACNKVRIGIDMQAEEMVTRRRLRYNGVSLTSQKYGIHKHTIRKGRKELQEKILPPLGKIRQKGGGRKKNFCNKKSD